MQSLEAATGFEAEGQLRAHRAGEPDLGRGGAVREYRHSQAAAEDRHAVHVVPVAVGHHHGVEGRKPDPGGGRAPLQVPQRDSRVYEDGAVTRADVCGVSAGAAREDAYFDRTFSW